jgi:hypothetical protein
MTLGQALAAQAHLIVWCKACQHHAEPAVADQVARYGGDTTVIDWASRLRCSACDGREVDFDEADAALAERWTRIGECIGIINSSAPTTLAGYAAKLRFATDAEVGIDAGDRPDQVPSLRQVLAFIEEEGEPVATSEQAAAISFEPFPADDVAMLIKELDASWQETGGIDLRLALGTMGQSKPRMVEFARRMIADGEQDQLMANRGDARER